MPEKGHNRTPAKILIADDHELCRQGIRALIEAERAFQVVGEARNGIEAVELAKKLKPDIVTMDLIMPALNGVKATEQILAGNPNIRILVLTMLMDPSVIRALLREGAVGFICKEEAGKNLIEGLSTVLQGRQYLSKQIALVLNASTNLAVGDQEISHLHLTVRELEVIRLLSLGKSSKQIAADLVLSCRTVETHRANIMRKLNFHSVTELLHYAFQNHLAESEISLEAQVL